MSNFAVRHRTSARDTIASECKLSERKLIRVLTARESRRLAARFCRLLKTCTFGLCYVIGIAVERSLCASNVEIARVNIHSSFSFLLGSKTPLFFVCPQRLSFIFLPLFFLALFLSFRPLFLLIFFPYLIIRTRPISSIHVPRLLRLS